MTAKAAAAGRQTKTRNLRRELIADLEQIEDNTRLYRAGRNSAYQAVAIQLRNVLLGGRRGLLARVVPNPTLHRVRPSHVPPHVLTLFETPNVNAFILDVRGSLRLSTTPPGAQVNIEFVEELVSLGTWLSDWIIRPDVTVERLIKQVADEEVAHTQDNVGETIARTEDFALGGAAQQRVHRHMVIVSLGEYVAKRVRELIGEPLATAREEHL
jgi:hypothetical protein